jgi:type II secretory pathway component PulF
MAKYRFNATDARGKWVSGEAEGESLEAVEAQLVAEGLGVESLVEAEGEAVGRVSRRDSLELVEQLAGLARSGLPLPSGLRAAGAEVDSPALRAIFEDLASQVESGVGLDRAILSSRDKFPEHLRGLILAGARSGRLADVLGEYVRNANLGAELRRKFWSVVAYPALSALIVLILVIGVCKLSVKAADTILTDLNAFNSLNVKSRSSHADALVLMAHFVADRWFEGLMLAVALGVGTWVLIRSTLTPARRRRLACGIPVLGPVLRFTSMTEFCRLLAMLLEAETPLPEAFELAGQGVRDADVAEASDRMARAVAVGQPLSTAFLLWDSMPAGLGQLFRWSQGHRSLPEALRLAGDMFEARARSQSAFAANVLNTFLALFILWWVGFALATLYLPMSSMLHVISALSG